MINLSFINSRRFGNVIPSKDSVKFFILYICKAHHEFYLETTLTTSLLSLNQEECLMTLHPRATNATFNILSPLQGSAWLGGLIMLMVILMGLISLAPDEESLFDILLWYTIESLGNIREQEKHFQDNDHALVGRTFNFLWRVAIFFLICAYNVELRAKAINQEFEHVPESVYDLEFPSDKTLLTPFGGSVALQVRIIYMF